MPSQDPAAPNGRLMARLDRGLATLSAMLAGVGALVLAYLMLATSLDVILRTSTGRGVHGVVEYSEIVMAALVFLGLGKAQRMDSHIAVDVLVQRLRPAVERVVVTLGLVLAVLLLLFIAYHTATSAVESFQTGERHYGIASVPLWPARAAIPIGLGVMALECAVQAIGRWTTQAEASSRQPVASV